MEEMLFKNPYDANKFYGKHSYDAYSKRKSVADEKLSKLMSSFGFEVDGSKNSFPSPMYIVLHFDTLTWSCYSAVGDEIARKSISRSTLTKWVKANPHRFSSKKFGL